MGKGKRVRAKRSRADIIQARWLTTALHARRKKAREAQEQES